MFDHSENTMPGSTEQAIYDYIYPFAHAAQSAKGTRHWNEKYTELTNAFQRVAKVMNEAHQAATEHTR